jgi:hypothetical protein
MSSASVETASGGAHGAQQRDPISRPVTALLLFASLALAAGLGIVAADQVHKINENNFSAFSQSATVFARNYAPSTFVQAPSSSSSSTSTSSTAVTVGARIGSHGVYLDLPTSVADPVAKVVKSSFSKTHDRVLLLLANTSVANGSKSEVITGTDLSNGIANVALDQVGSNVEAVVTLRRPGTSFHLVPQLTSFSHEIEVVVTFPSSSS